MLESQLPHGKPGVPARSYSQPEMGAPRGVKGLLEQAGFRVFNPTLPCHWTSRAKDVGCTFFGRAITAQVYVETYLQVPNTGGPLS